MSKTNSIIFFRVFSIEIFDIYQKLSIIIIQTIQNQILHVLVDFNTDLDNNDQKNSRSVPKSNILNYNFTYVPTSQIDINKIFYLDPKIAIKDFTSNLNNNGRNSLDQLRYVIFELKFYIYYLVFDRHK